MANGVSNSQSQSQNQTISITVDSSSNPELEQRIFSRVHSAGRQLSRLSAVVELLLQAHGADAGFASSDADKEVIDDFRQLRQDIEKAKRDARDPEQLFQQLEALKRDDPQAFATLRDRLSTLLISTDA